MPQNTKEKIIEQAYQLFYEKGYFDVSMRDIADSLGMSVGNLTYHFKRKEDLVEAALLNRTHRYPHSLTIPQNLKELHEFLSKRTKNLEDDPFYFRTMYQLAELFPSFMESRKDAIEGMERILSECLAFLVEQGVIKPFATEVQRKGYIHTIAFTCFFGLPFLENLASKNVHKELMVSMWSVTLPLLTEKGIEEFETIARQDSNVAGLLAPN